ncbi:MAG TPA: tryptophan halogenase family protein [Sphingomonas sp.]
MSAPGRIGRVVIVGGGTAGWMTAAALAHVLAPLGLSIALIESEAIGTVGVGEATIPPIGMFNAMLGIDEDEFLRATQGTYKLGIEFADWWRPGHRYMHPFGPFGTAMRGVDFQHFWLKGRALGDPHPLSSYSLAETAARESRFTRPIADPPNSPLATISYAFHFDAGLYAAYLRTRAERAGVVRHEGRVVGVEHHAATGHVASVRLDDDRLVEGDLFVDCSGFRGLLIEGAMNAGYENWGAYLPCDRAVAVPSAVAGPPSPYTRSTARPAGWQWRIPLRHRTGNGYVYASGHVSDEEAAATLLGSLDAPALAEPRFLRFTAGHRRRMWVGNVVALGLAAGFLEPLESTSIHLVQTGIQRLLALFPNDHFEIADADRFNVATIAEYRYIRDFLILHYRATERVDTPFWRAARALDMPPTLTDKVALFAANGRLFRDADDLFGDASWLAVLVGQGIMPRGHHPLADQLSDAETLARLGAIRDVIRRAADTMPAQTAFLAARLNAAG